MTTCWAGQQQKGRQVFSFNDLSPFFEKIQAAAAAADQKRQREEPVSLFENEVSRLRDNLVLFQRLTMSFTPPSDTPVKDYALWQDSLLPGSEAVLAKDAGKPFDEKELDTFAMFARLYMQLSNNAIVGIIPPRTGDPASAPWTNLGSGALAALDPKLPNAFHVNPILLGYAQMGRAVRDDDPKAFNRRCASRRMSTASSRFSAGRFCMCSRSSARARAGLAGAASCAAPRCV
jgi:hypothetical protein